MSGPYLGSDNSTQRQRLLKGSAKTPRMETRARVIVYRAPSQAGSGNDIYTGSPGLRKAPMWARQPGRYSGC